MFSDTDPIYCAGEVKTAHSAGTQGLSIAVVTSFDFAGTIDWVIIDTLLLRLRNPNITHPFVKT